MSNENSPHATSLLHACQGLVHPIHANACLELLRQCSDGQFSGESLSKRMSADFTNGVVTPELATVVWNFLITAEKLDLLTLRDDAAPENVKDMETSRAINYLHGNLTPHFLRALRR